MVQRDDFCIPTDQSSKKFADVRDRVAYVYLTGAFPTHLRSHSINVLRSATKLAKGEDVEDGRKGPVKVLPEIAQQLNLNIHPMVAKVEDLIGQGYQIVIQPGKFTERRPYSKIFLHLSHAVPDKPRKLIVHLDGAVREGWA